MYAIDIRARMTFIAVNTEISYTEATKHSLCKDRAMSKSAVKVF